MKNLKNNLFVWALTAWLGLGCIGDFINVYRNNKVYTKNDAIYKTGQDFQIDLEKEKRKLNLENISIHCKIDSEVKGGCTWKKKDYYLIHFNPEMRNKKILRHELYHVKQWEEGFILKEIADFLTCGNYEEFMATSYSIE